MITNKSNRLGMLVGTVSLLVITSAYATDNFVKVSLPKGVSIELPKNWVVRSKDQLLTVDTFVKSRLDKANIKEKVPNLTFAADYYENDKGKGKVQVRYYPHYTKNQSDARKATLKNINELDTKLKNGFEIGVNSAKDLGWSILSWEGTKKKVINGITVFITEYSRNNPEESGPFRVRLIRVFAGDKSFTLIVSYYEEVSNHLKPITDRIIESLNLSGIDITLVQNAQSTETTKSADSVLSQIGGYGDSWLLMLALSAIITWGIGLTPPLLIRFLFVRRPIGKGLAIGTAIIFWPINIVLLTALGSTSKTHGALILVAWVSYAILRKGVNEVAVTNMWICDDCGRNNSSEDSECRYCSTHKGLNLNIPKSK